jgi:hypothetical protein
MAARQNGRHGSTARIATEQRLWDITEHRTRTKRNCATQRAASAEHNTIQPTHHITRQLQGYLTVFSIQHNLKLRTAFNTE